MTFPNCKYLLVLAECFINVGDTTEASSCLLEAAAVFPLSPDVLYMVGNLCPLKTKNLIINGRIVELKIISSNCLFYV